MTVGQGETIASGQAVCEKETNSELRGHQETQEELARVKQAAQEMEKEIAALVAQEDYSGAAKVHSLLIWLQEERAGLRQSIKERLERSREILAQDQEAKNRDNMTEHLTRNDYAGDQCGHRSGLAPWRRHG